MQGITHLAAGSDMRPIRTVFAAAAIRHDWLNPGERYGRALCSTDCLINLENRYDPALFIYPLSNLFAGRSLGSIGFTDGDRRDLGNWSRKVQDYDVSEFIGVGHLWPRFLQDQRLAWLIRNFVYFPKCGPTAGTTASGEQTVSETMVLPVAFPSEPANS